MNTSLAPLRRLAASPVFAVAWRTGLLALVVVGGSGITRWRAVTWLAKNATEVDAEAYLAGFDAASCVAAAVAIVTFAAARSLRHAQQALNAEDQS